MSVIGGSQYTKSDAAPAAVQTSSAVIECRWSVMLFVGMATLLFGGAAGSWFSPQGVSQGAVVRIIQLTAGCIAMGLLVAIPGSLLFGRNPIRWGMGMPVFVYLGGTFFAALCGRDGFMGLVWGAPVLLGLSIAAGVMGAFLIDGLGSREGRE